MKFDFKAVIKDINGEDLKEGNKGITLGLLSIRALDAKLPGEEDPKTEIKLERWDLMVRIRDGGEIEKSELKLIKERIGQAFPASIVGACHALLAEPAPPKAVKAG